MPHNLPAIFHTEPVSLVTVAAFFLIAYAFTWSLHGLIIIFRLPYKRNSKSIAQVLYILGLGGPLVAAFLLTQILYGKVGILDLLSGASHWRFEVIWYIAAIAPLAIIYLTSSLLYGLSRKELFAPFNRPSMGFLPLILSQVWVVIAEEFGWRGFALPFIQEYFGWLIASFVIGILWASWHLPMFFVKGSNQYGSSFPKYAYVVTVWSFFMAMLYHQTNGSILPCMIFHATANIWAFTINVPERAERYAHILHLPMLLIAVALL